ncbi:MAG: hypothetical protein ACLSG9_06665 [Eubacterium sp.]|jgi:ATP-dependent DNA helicase RecG
MERRGSGFKKILADYEGQVEFDETKMPVFEAKNDDFTLTLYNLNYGTNYTTQVSENVIENVTDRTIARYISELKDKGIIERKGPDNGGKWKIR